MIVIEAYKGKSVLEQQVEIVERKGTGHPDFICDSIMDAISIALSREYVRECGKILHHNIDKSLLAAGSVVKSYGGGRVVKPMELTIGDRATFRCAGKEIPVAEIAIDAAKRWFRENLRLRRPGTAPEIQGGACSRFGRAYRYFFPAWRNNRRQRYLGRCGLLPVKPH